MTAVVLTGSDPTAESRPLNHDQVSPKKVFSTGYGLVASYITRVLRSMVCLPCIQHSSKGLRSSWRGCLGRFLGQYASVLLQPRVLLSLALVVLGGATLMILWSWLAVETGLGVGTPDSQASKHVERSYSVVIDAGSSSSKLHLFQWPLHDGDPSKLLTIKPLVDELGDPLTKKVEPGIATFSNSPDTAFTSLQPLLDYALVHIPPSHHQHTSLYIFGTAGMRLLSRQDQQRIVGVLNERVSKEYPFYLPKDGIQVISGKLEGAFSWIAINYLVGRLSPESHQQQQQPPELSLNSSGGSELQPIHTVGSLDLGGASLQVAFEVAPDINIPPELTVDINLGCGAGGTAGNQHKHRIFVNTYLGYGSNEARTRYYQHLLRTHLKTVNQSHHFDTATHLHSLRDPCAPLDTTENITVDGHSIKIRGLGDFRGCKKALLHLLQTNSSGGRSNTRSETSGSAVLDATDRGVSSQFPCTGSQHNCNDNRIRDFQRPSLPFKYDTLDFYGTSEFWYTMRDVLQIGGHYTVYSYEKASSQYCQTSWKVLLERFLKRLYVYADFYRLKSQCMKSAWLSVILHEGLGFSKDTISLHSVASIKGQSVQWPLGALIYNTRYLPLREVQLHQLQAPPVSQTQLTYLSYLLQSSFLPPLLTVLVVVLLLLCCRHRRRRRYSAVPTSPSYNPLHRSKSLNSLLKIYRRGPSYSSASALHIAGMGATPPTQGLASTISSSGGSGFTKEDVSRSYSRSKFMV